MSSLAAAACLAHSALRAPAPGVNEPHYLAKALHWIDPAWCQGDFFLESSNPHLVFYTLVGPGTAVLTFPAVAWLGRVLVLSLLATGWVAMVRRLVPDTWAGWTATTAFLLAASIGNLSGEWVVGGFESKVVAYGLLAWSSAFGLAHRHRLAGDCGDLRHRGHLGRDAGRSGLQATTGGCRTNDRWRFERGHSAS